MNVSSEEKRRTDLLIDLVAIATRMDRTFLVAGSRGLAGSARARQVAMYLAHTGYGLSLTKVGTLFQRDKSTVGHAVRQIEDLRDCEAFDDWISGLETALEVNAQMLKPATGSLERYFPVRAARELAIS